MKEKGTVTPLRGVLLQCRDIERCFLGASGSNGKSFFVDKVDLVDSVFARKIVEG